MFSSSLTFSRAANLFVISILYCFLTSRSFSFLRLNFSPSNFYAACFLTAYLSLNLPPPDSGQCHNQLHWNFVHIVFSNAISYLSICGQSGYESAHQERSRCTYECSGAGTGRWVGYEVYFEVLRGILYFIYRETQLNNQLNDRHTVQPNPIFETLTHIYSHRGHSPPP
jgi:hypothetical protein